MVETESGQRVAVLKKPEKISNNNHKINRNNNSNKSNDYNSDDDDDDNMDQSGKYGPKLTSSKGSGRESGIISTHLFTHVHMYPALFTCDRC